MRQVYGVPTLFSRGFAMAVFDTVKTQALFVISGMVFEFLGMHPDNHDDAVSGADLVSWLDQNIGECPELKEWLRSAHPCQGGE